MTEFEVKTIESLSRIEEKLTNYERICNIANEGNNRSVANEKEIMRILSISKKAVWTAITSFLTVIGGIILILVDRKF